MNLKNVMYGTISLFFLVASLCAVSIACTYSSSKRTVEIDYGGIIYRESVSSTYEAARLFHKMGYDYQRAEEKVDETEQRRYRLENRD